MHARELNLEFPWPTDNFSIGGPKQETVFAPCGVGFRVRPLGRKQETSNLPMFEVYCRGCALCQDKEEVTEVRICIETNAPAHIIHMHLWQKHNGPELVRLQEIERKKDWKKRCFIHLTTKELLDRLRIQGSHEMEITGVEWNNDPGGVLIYIRGEGLPDETLLPDHHACTRVNITDEPYDEPNRLEI